MGRYALAVGLVLMAANAWGQETKIDGKIESANASGRETKVDSKIESASLFKNGLAVVERSVNVDGPGVYRIEDVPTPLHGTFWVKADEPVEAQTTMRDVTGPARSRGGDFQQELVGKQVVVIFKVQGVPGVIGKVVALKRSKGDEAWNRDYQRRDYEDYAGGSASPGGFLVIDGEQGRTYANISEVASLTVRGGDGNEVHRQPMLLLTVGGDKKPSTIHFSYLSKGLAWTPSYRVELLDDKNLSIEQQAVIKNEMADLKDAEISLISGYPSIQSANVISPLAMVQTWADFFSQLLQGETYSNVMTQQVANSASNLRSIGARADFSATPEGEGADVHYQSIGRRTLAEGDALAISVAKEKAGYDRIVEWIVPDTRDGNGAYVQDYQRQQSPDKYQDSAWDSLRFKNPLPFAMTTAPAMVIDGGHFAGQRLSYWVNSGEQTTLQITKALSVRTRATEQEDAQDGDRAVVFVGGTRYMKVNVKGELTVSNHRKQDINLVIRRQFSGDLDKADGDPKVTLREEGVYSVNRRSQMSWELPLKSGETRTLTYNYKVLTIRM